MVAWLAGKAILSVLSFLGGKLAAGLPFLLQYFSKKEDNRAELERIKLENEVRKEEAVRRVADLQAQVAALLATASVVHQAAEDRVTEKLIDATSGNSPLPFKNPRGWFQKLVDGLVVLTNAYNAWMRPYAFALTINLDAALVILEGYVLFYRPDLQDRVSVFAGLTVVEVFTSALPMMLGAIYGERSYAKRLA